MAAFRLRGLRMADGSRHFADLPQTKLWQEVRDHVEKLAGAQLTGFVCDFVTEAWIDFKFRGQEFSINDQMGEYWFFVKDPACTDDILREVVAHFGAMLSH